ncbi:ATPase AAA [Hysterangium stoloniferum]|nr:ATPase AAA [Hysterangium stoloniferum]
MRPDLSHSVSSRTGTGLEPSRGILLYGPLGTGKTRLARAVPPSTYAPTLAISGPSLASAYHSESKGKLREVLREAREKSPCVVIIDDVDTLCPRREDGAGGEVRKRIVATFGRDDGLASAVELALGGRFEQEIEIGIPPDSPSSKSSLRAPFLNTCCDQAVLYVGPPDGSSREDIFRIRTTKTAVNPS